MVKRKDGGSASGPTRWTEQIQRILDGSHQLVGQESPEAKAYCEQVWLSHLAVDPELTTNDRDYGRLLNKASADGPKQRKLIVAVIKALITNGWLNTLGEANELLSVLDWKVRVDDPKLPPLGNAPRGMKYPEEYREIERDIYRELLRREQESQSRLSIQSGPVPMDGAIDALERFLSRLDNSICYIESPAGAGKSEAVRQLLARWCLPGSPRPPYRRLGGKRDGTDDVLYRFVTFDLRNELSQDTELLQAINFESGKLASSQIVAGNLPEAAHDFLLALKLARADSPKSDEGIPKDLIFIDNAADARLAEVLLAGANHPDVIKDFDLTLLVTGRPGSIERPAISRSLNALPLQDPAGFQWSGLQRYPEVVKAILRRDLGALGQDSETILESIAETIWHWPSLAALANDKLIDPVAGHRVADRVTGLYRFLHDNRSALEAAKKNPDTFKTKLAQFGADPYRAFWLDRRAKLIQDAREHGYDLERQFVLLTISLPGVGTLPDTAKSLWQAIQKAAERQPDQVLFVLTAPPGGGKSTLFRHLEWEMATAALRPGSDLTAPLVLYVPLNQVQPPGVDPWQYLHQVWWPKHQGGLPSLAGVVSSRPVWLLLDAANELKPFPGETIEDRMRVWAEHARGLIPGNPNHRVIFSCRQRDAGMVFRDAHVAEISANAMDDKQLGEFLACYLSDVSADKVESELRRARALDSRADNPYRLPLWLKLLCDHINDRGELGIKQLPRNKAMLISSLIRRRLRAERKKGTGPLRDHPHLVTRNQWREIDLEEQAPHFLTSFGSKLLPGLERLAKGMLGNETSTSPELAVTWIRDDSSAVLGCAQNALDLIHSDLDLNEPIEGWDSRNPPALEFTHQQFLEYFAGRAMAREEEPEIAKIKMTQEEVGPWDEAFLFAAAMVPDGKLVGFIEAIKDVNLPLAARCAGQADVRDRLERTRPELLAALRRALQLRLSPETDIARAARIACAAALFDVGHPDYEEHTIIDGHKSVRFLMPAPSTLVAVAAGEYLMGADDLTPNEKPRHRFKIEHEFSIAKFPVTNHEFACFVDDDGYGDPRWWGGSLASERRRANGANKDLVLQMLREAEAIKSLSQVEFDDQMNYYARQPRRQRWLTERRTVPLIELESQFREEYPSGKNESWPAFWLDPSYNGPGQPVVGVDYFEAEAYARWLSARCAAKGLDYRFRLPDEDEWESACGGVGGCRWAADDIAFDPTKYNTAETVSSERPVGRTTPVGAFPRGSTREGVQDMTGNVWEWTLTQFVEGQPRDVHIDIRSLQSAEAGLQVVRGGSWLDDQTNARTATRYGSVAFRGHDLGFRLIC